MRRARSLNDVLEDKNFVYQVGKLVGAAEMTSHWLQLQKENEEAQALGAKLHEVVGWFFEPERNP